MAWPGEFFPQKRHHAKLTLETSGRPSTSHYFLGVQDSHLFFLDPHTTRPTTAYHPDQLYTQEELDSYYTTRLRRIHIKDMDPSMLIGFLIKNEDDWLDLKKRIQTSTGKPIVHISPSQQTNEGGPREEAWREVESLSSEDEEFVTVDKKVES